MENLKLVKINPTFELLTFRAEKKLNQWLRLPHDQNMRGIIGEDSNPLYRSLF
jgi:hypothetical protein